MIERNLKHALRIALAAAAAVLLAVFASQALSYMATRSRTREALALKEKIAPSEKADIRGRDLSAFESLANAEIFGAKPKQEPQPPQFSGLMGDMAILNGEMKSIGDEINGWKLAEIKGQTVVVTLEDRRQELSLFESRDNLQIDNRQKGGGGGPPPQPPSGPGASGGGRGEGRASARGGPASPRRAEDPAAPPSDNGSARAARGGGDGPTAIPAEALAGVGERIRGMNPGEIEERLSSMPPEAAEQIREAIRRQQEANQ